MKTSLKKLLYKGIHFSSFRDKIHSRKLNYFCCFSLPYFVAGKRHSYKDLKTTVVFGLYYSSNVSVTEYWGLKHEEEYTSASTNQGHIQNPTFGMKEEHVTVKEGKKTRN